MWCVVLCRLSRVRPPTTRSSRRYTDRPECQAGVQLCRERTRAFPLPSLSHLIFQWLFTVSMDFMLGSDEQRQLFRTWTYTQYTHAFPEPVRIVTFGGPYECCLRSPCGIDSQYSVRPTPLIPSHLTFITTTIKTTYI